MEAEHFDQKCPREVNSLCGGWLFVASWFSASRCDVVSLGEMPPQVSTFFRWKGDYTLMNKDTEAK